MNDEGLTKHLQQEIKAVEKKIGASKLEKNKQLLERKHELLSSLLRYAQGKPTREDAVVADVINDLMQSLPLLSKSRTFRDR